MKLIYSFSILALLVLPLTSHAAWYWLSNPSYPEEGDFVELSALEYAEFESAQLLTLVEDKTLQIVNKVKKFDACEKEYDAIINSYQTQSFDTLNYWLTKSESCITEQVRLEKIEEALDECDLDFVIEESSGSELVRYSDTIKKCKETEAQKSEIEPSVPTNVVDMIPVEIATPVQIPIKEVKEVQDEGMGESMPEESADMQEVSSTTNPEADPIVEKNNVEIIEEPEAVNLFQRIKNFFKNLFNW